jgi:hypothetical protein
LGIIDSGEFSVITMLFLAKMFQQAHALACQSMNEQGHPLSDLANLLQPYDIPSSGLEDSILMGVQ